MPKINWKKIIVYSLVVGLLVYTRLINLSWGLPYPFHPDERNMANAVQQLNCKISSFQFPRDCFNPHFFAYGQFPLYLGYLLIKVLKFFDGHLAWPTGFSEATISLRLISAVASFFTAIVLIKIINFIVKEKSVFFFFLTSFLIIFSPYAIQFSHFGTTESLLMFFYSLIIYFSLKLQSVLGSRKKEDRSGQGKLVFFLSLSLGLAAATKLSAVIFILVPLTVSVYEILFSSSDKFFPKFSMNMLLRKLKNLGKITGSLVFFTLFFALVFSPHNWISWADFINTLRYETGVATGKIAVFYTRQFIGTIPVLFQLEKIFPYALGLPMSLMGFIGLLGLGWKDRRINLLRLAFLIYFLPNAFLFAKWTRFMAPVFPILVIFAILFLLKIKVINIIKFIIVILAIIPGIAYLSVYQKQDVRFQASDWIYKNIPANAYILSETANVVDLPVPSRNFSDKNYRLVSFDFYDLENDPLLQKELSQHQQKADYIFVPSRRLFMNHSCYRPEDLRLRDKIVNFITNRCQQFQERYPLINDYYQKLFSGELVFKKIAEFSSYPRINFQFSIFSFQLIFPDEGAEETWTVFDHPVVRIYRRF